MTKWLVDQFWEEYLYYFSGETSRKFLLKKYEELKLDEPLKKSFANSNAFIYYLEQGKIFFDQAENSPVNIKPILIFYGLSFLTKAALLTVDPDYPATTSVLAHGVSTRKRKKQDYQYLQDEVKVQKYGLFPHFSNQLFHINQLEGEKFTIKSLLKQVPELQKIFVQWEEQEIALPVKKENEAFIVPTDILDVFKMSKERFGDYIHNKTNHFLTLDPAEKNIVLRYPKNHQKAQAIEIVPFRFNALDRSYSFIKENNSLTFLPELMIHYLLLYHLSMLARYEVEWWSEFILYKEGIEYPMIIHYLQISIGKCLFLLSDFLLK